MGHETLTNQMELGLLIGVACIMLTPMVFGGITAILSLKLENKDSK
jgi:hypothetical protein